MKKIKITKSQLLDAIETEPLRAGDIIKKVGSEDYNDCEVCAVGAILRRKLTHINEVNKLTEVAFSYLDQYGYYCAGYIRRVPNLLKSKKYLNALSVKFENLSETNSILETRKKLSRWVKRNFPESFTVTINDQA